ncbi:hypothetical protein AFLA_004395 [Aspergillus flavus NRRL3357]|nr:hypothetical protein AFLA_004395 [Aspergillus flavus NRRL3357]
MSYDPYVLSSFSGLIPREVHPPKGSTRKHLIEVVIYAPFLISLCKPCQMGPDTGTESPLAPELCSETSLENNLWFSSPAASKNIRLVLFCGLFANFCA